MNTYKARIDQLEKENQTLREIRESSEAQSKALADANAHAAILMVELEEKNKSLNEARARTEEAYEDLKRAKAMLQQSEKMAAVGQLAGGLAHEINNPMGVILGFASSLAKRVNEGDPLYMPLKSIEREAWRCKSLIKDLLTFSRMGKLEPELVDFNQTIEEALLLVDARAKVQKVTIYRDFTAITSAVKVNKNQIQQVVINLCNNAIDAMPNGGVVTVETVFLEKETMIKVRDMGCGIPKDKLEKVFEPFYTTKDIGKGTGLGLSLCYEIIQQHEGTIRVESQVGKGSTFFITLPHLK